MNVLPRELLETFQFRYRNWDAMTMKHPPFLTEPFRLTRDEHAEIVATVERVHRAVALAREAAVRDPELGEYLGLDVWTRQVVAAEARTRKRSVEIARYDFFKTAEGWKISEINHDVPSGFNESSCLAEIVRPEPGETQPVLVTERFVDAIAGLGAKDVAMTYGTAYAEDLQLCLFLGDRLRTRGCRTMLASPSHLRIKRGRPSFWDEAVDAVYRVYPTEWFSALPERREWEALVASDAPLVNPLGGIVPQSKNFFGMLHENEGRFFSQEEWRWMKRHVPFTKRFERGDASRLRAEKDRWVLKPVFGRMGYDVAIGKILPQQAWEAALGEAARRSEAYCVQKFFETLPEKFELGDCYLCIGVFVIDGRFSGYFTRASLNPLTTYEAMDVATLIGRS